MSTRKSRKPLLLFVTDPWHTLDHANDTTLRLIEAGVKQKLPVFWADVRSIRFDQGRVVLDAFSFDRELAARSRLKSAKYRAPRNGHWTARPDDFDQIHYRVDPPVDLAYLHPLQLLALDGSDRIINPILELTASSEKLLASHLGELFPKTCVSSDRRTLENFVKSQGHCVLKPLHLAQSRGVEKLAARKLQKANARLKKATENFSRPVLLQEYLKEVATQGETRLWFLDGKLLSAVQKLPARGKFVIDMDRGGSLARTTLSAAQKRQASRIGVLLRRHRIRLAAVDWIAGKITDFNFTSPGLIVPMEKILNQDLAAKIMRGLAKSPR